MEENMCPHRKLERSEAESKSLIHRLNRIEGQIRGIRNMVEQSAYCPEILVQASAAKAAMDAFSRELLASHVRHCVAEDLQNGKMETVDELVSILGKMM